MPAFPVYMAVQARLQRQIALFLESERGRIILFVPVALGIGVASYFVRSTEPAYFSGVAAAIGGTALAIGARHPWQRMLALGMMLAGIGFIAAKVEAERLYAPALSHELSIRTVSGTVEQAVTLPKGIKLILRDPVIERLPQTETPRRVSVTVKNESASIPAGAGVKLRAGLYPPPERAMPGSFDFARHFYFRQIGAVGYGLPPVEIIQATAELPLWQEWMANFRTRLSTRIYANMKTPYGGLAAGFLTGETNAVPEEVYETMRQAGLTHLLAVSGFNLVVVTGTVFFSIRLFLAAVPMLALRWPIKRWAAFGALVAGALYLWLTGAPVSAERAFVMSSLLLIAIIIDRVPTPIRSIAFAAVVLLIFEPHSLLTASFQLSFSAALALIAFYDHYRLQLHEAIGARRILYYLSGAFLSALVAGLSTAPFILYHFNQIATYTLIANMLSAPLVTFWIMPVLLLSLVAMPLGLEAWPLKLAEWGIAAMLKVAESVVELPGALLHVPPMTAWGLGCVALGGVWWCLLASRIRLLGIPLVLVGVASCFTYTPPDILVGPEGKYIAVRREDGSLMLWSGKRATFQNKQWLETLGEDDFIYRKNLLSGDGRQGCDEQGCSLELHGYHVTFVDDPNALAEECVENDVLIVPFFVSLEACPVNTLIDRSVLREGGAHTVTLGRQVKIETAAGYEGQRFWSPKRKKL